MAPESIRKREYSEKSDVWSFGIVVWEIIYKDIPHSKLEIFEAALKIRDEKLTPEITPQSPPMLTKLMQSCWAQDPTDRPTFDEICQFLRAAIAAK
jgi:serine/threonine protein kinase